MSGWTWTAPLDFSGLFGAVAAEGRRRLHESDPTLAHEIYREVMAGTPDEILADDWDDACWRNRFGPGDEVAE